MIPLARPDIGPDELEAVRSVLKSGQLVQGQRVRALEEIFEAHCGRAHGVAVANGTVALELALTVLGIGAGDEVICPNVSWPSPAHAIRLRGAVPVLIDVDLHEWNPTAAAYKAAKSAKTKAAIVIDQFGNPARGEEIIAALGASIPIIEDAACAIGSLSAHGPCGKLGVISCFSFHPRKIITTGEGGMCVTDDKEIADTLKMLRNHGQKSPGVFDCASGNHRLSEVAAAIAIPQMQRLASSLSERRNLAERYHQGFDHETTGLLWQKEPEGALGNFQTMGVLLPPGSDKHERDKVIETVRNRGVEIGPLSYAIHRLKSMQTQLSDNQFPVSARIVDTGFALPLYNGMMESDQDTVIEIVTSTIRGLIK